ncbi:DUF2946 family protein [Hylemonella gracilis]|uniref:DUF2946 domain-containing protein n=1 Tax=Hylemonella gracilis ATCC 19624 TaxID=887062 RepID=F3KWH3_9BURK|nr:DUF2946 family protein [Hylemonella gracilis]EGI75880.1 hypothetical protein HGR_14059 [Hylemonella gracilis ATCC 19624]
MQTLRRARYLARLVLAGFALALGVAIASPIVQPKTMELVCAADGVMKWVAQDGEEGAAASHAHALDCPLCVQVLTPPSVPVSVLQHDAPLARALLPLVAAHIAGRTASPLPPRGPPAFS